MENQQAREDIKGKRESHLSSPVGNDTEFHLRTAGLSCDPKVGERYYVCFPVECTSRGEDSGVDMARFVQMGKPDVSELTEDLDTKVKKVAKMAYRPKE
jgi:hypothetical protein